MCTVLAVYWTCKSSSETMRISVLTDFYQLLVILWLFVDEVICCQEFTKEREMKRIRTCLSYWSMYENDYEPTVEDLFKDDMKNEICKIGSRRRVRLCITHIAGRCKHLLIYWRHVYDPISHICDTQHDFNNSKICREHPVFQNSFQFCQKEYSRFQNTDKCWKYKWHKDCLMAFIQRIDECKPQNTLALIDRVLFYHYRHMAAYNHCRYEHKKPLPNVDILLATNNQTLTEQT